MVVPVGAIPAGVGGELPSELDEDVDDDDDESEDEELEPLGTSSRPRVEARCRFSVQSEHNKSEDWTSSVRHVGWKKRWQSSHRRRMPPGVAQPVHISAVGGDRAIGEADLMGESVGVGCMTVEGGMTECSSGVEGMVLSSPWILSIGMSDVVPVCVGASINWGEVGVSSGVAVVGELIAETSCETCVVLFSTAIRRRSRFGISASRRVTESE